MNDPFYFVWQGEGNAGKGPIKQSTSSDTKDKERVKAFVKTYTVDEGPVGGITLNDLSNFNNRCLNPGALQDKYRQIEMQQARARDLRINGSKYKIEDDKQKAEELAKLKQGVLDRVPIVPVEAVVSRNKKQKKLTLEVKPICGETGPRKCNVCKKPTSRAATCFDCLNKAMFK